MSRSSFWDAGDGVMGTEATATAACPGEGTCCRPGSGVKPPGSPCTLRRAEEISLVQKHQQSSAPWERPVAAVVVLLPGKTPL